MVLAGTTLYLIDTNGESTAPLAEWLHGAGATDVREISLASEAPWRIGDRLDLPDAAPALALIVTSTSVQLLDICRRLRRLIEEGSLGVVALFNHGLPSADRRRALRAAGCADILRLGKLGPDEELHGRLLLALQLVQERHLRISRERSYQTQLAQRRVAEARLHYSATHDELTDLANRRAFEKALDLAIAEGARRGFTSALLYLDLDRFKLHNDAVGHGSGDHLLRTVANLFRGALPPEYLLARLGSDEFAVLVAGSDEREAMALAERLRDIIATLEPDGEKLVYHVGISIGLAVMAPGEVTSASHALAHAEQACYVAKTRGGNVVHRFRADDGALQNLHDDMRWTQPIRRALAENRFFLAFQPILSVAQKRISHYEALLRIPTGLGGDGQSASFMLAAERLGLARQIDLWIVENAIDFLAERDNISLGVNLSSHAFEEAALLPLLTAKLEASEIDPGRLTFEITETAAIMNFAETRRMIGEIRDLGCRFALDDFGSGFSSYNYIKQFPVDMLKIDGSFVVGMRNDRRDQAIVQSMVDIGHGLDKEVVAEFIEDAETYQLLVKMGIDYAQGYYIGRPAVDPATTTPLPTDKEEP